MEKVFKCADVDSDLADCEFVASGEEELVLAKAKEHLLSMHDFEEEDLSSEMEDKITLAIAEDDSMLIPPDESEQI